MTMSNAIQNRYDFVFLFDVKDGNPNGDPDAGNLPRVDIEDQHGIVTDVCIKRKVRNYVELKHKEEAPNKIFIRQGNVLNSIIDPVADKHKEMKARQDDLASTYFDIRTFGAVMSTGKGAGTLRGPVQLTFARSVDRIFQAEHSITRCAVTTEKEAKAQEAREHASTFGRKFTVPYALYRMHGFISATDANRTHFSEEDLALFFEALWNGFEHDRAAARGEMTAREILVFKHGSVLGNARSSELFERVTIEKKNELPRSYDDYSVTVVEDGLSANITLLRGKALFA